MVYLVKRLHYAISMIILKKNLLKILTLLAGLTITGLFVYQSLIITPKQTDQLPNYPRKSAIIGKENFTLLETQTEEQHRLGLGAVNKLPKDHGMLFSGSGTMGIWMKGMKYSIDIIWLDKNGTVLHVEHSVHPKTYPKTFTNPPGSFAVNVVELNAGVAKQLGLKNGDKITIR